MSDKFNALVSALGSDETAERWVEKLEEINEGLRYGNPKTETEEEIKSRVLAKLNGKEDAQIECI